MDRGIDQVVEQLATAGRENSANNSRCLRRRALVGSEAFSTGQGKARCQRAHCGGCRHRDVQATGRWRARGKDRAGRRVLASTRFPPRKTKGRPQRWLVVVARDEDEIHAKLRQILTADRHVRVIFDRRANDLRNPPWVTRSLRTHGFAVVPVGGQARASSSRSAGAVRPEGGDARRA